MWCSHRCKFMIVCFNEKINTFDEKSLKNFKSYNDRNSYIQSLMPDISNLDRIICPCCHAKNKLIKFGTYERNLSCLLDNSIENYRVTVNRVICKSCLHTHALLPNFIIPYKIMAIFSIAKIVQNATKSSVYQLSQIINLSYQYIYSLIALILGFFDDFKILNNSKEYYKIKKFNQNYFLKNSIKYSNVIFRLDYFEFYNWILFMQKFRNNFSPPITISISNLANNCHQHNN